MAFFVIFIKKLPDFRYCKEKYDAQVKFYIKKRVQITKLGIAQFGNLYPS